MHPQRLTLNYFKVIRDEILYSLKKAWLSKWGWWSSYTTSQATCQLQLPRQIGHSLLSQKWAVSGVFILQWQHSISIRGESNSGAVLLLAEENKNSFQLHRKYECYICKTELFRRAVFVHKLFYFPASTKTLQNLKVKNAGFPEAEGGVVIVLRIQGSASPLACVRTRIVVFDLLL